MCQYNDRNAHLSISMLLKSIWHKVAKRSIEQMQHESDASKSEKPELMRLHVAKRFKLLQIHKPRLLAAALHQMHSNNPCNLTLDSHHNTDADSN